MESELTALRDGSQDSKAEGRTLARSSGQDSLRQVVRGAKQRIESQLITKALDNNRRNRLRGAVALQITHRSSGFRRIFHSSWLRDGMHSKSGNTISAI